MNLFFALSMLLGSMVVFQPVLNRLVFAEKGLGFGVWLNSSVLFGLGSLFFFFIFALSERFPESLPLKSGATFRWWFVLPGLIGFLLVSLVPLMIKNLGAFPTIAAMLLGQVTTSFLYDTLAEGHPVDLTRLAGLALTAAGAYLSFRPPG
jgi:uncharacterized membrane protein YdcZ (DUF606 family)